MYYIVIYQWLQRYSGNIEYFLNKTSKLKVVHKEESVMDGRDGWKNLSLKITVTAHRALRFLIMII